MAKFCWEMGDEPVTTAIAVTRLYSAMIRYISRDESILRDTVIGYKQWVHEVVRICTTIDVN